MINWTKAEEVFPEFGTKVLVYVYLCSRGTYDSEIHCMVYHGSPYMFAFYNEEDLCWYGYDCDSSDKLNVVAWCYLSEPRR